MVNLITTILGVFKNTVDIAQRSISVALHSKSVLSKNEKTSVETHCWSVETHFWRKQAEQEAIWCRVLPHFFRTSVASRTPLPHIRVYFKIFVTCYIGARVISRFWAYGRKMSPFLGLEIFQGPT